MKPFLIDPRTRYIEMPEGKGAIVICMKANSYLDGIKKIIILPDVTNHHEAYQTAKSLYRLDGEWAEQVGITIVKSDENVWIPTNWDECEVQYLNGKVF